MGLGEKRGPMLGNQGGGKVMGHDSYSDTRTLWPYIIALVVIIGIAGIFVYQNQNRSSILFGIAGELEIVILEGPRINRTIFVDTNKWYCKTIAFKGGNKVDPFDLAFPNGDILYYFFEDIADPAGADNFRDLIIGLNLGYITEDKITQYELNVDGEGLYCWVVFFGEGGYGKDVYYQGELIYEYRDYLPESNYGIALIKIEITETGRLVI